MVLGAILTIFTLTLLGYVTYTFFKAEGDSIQKFKNVTKHTIEAWEK